MYDLTPIVKAVFITAAAIITYVVVPYITKKTTVQQQAEINAWVKIAVSAAEQIFRGQGRGEEKKNYVLGWLENNGIWIDETKIDALIEAAVYELNNGLFTTVEEIAEV